VLNCVNWSIVAAPLKITAGRHPVPLVHTHGTARLGAHGVTSVFSLLSVGCYGGFLYRAGAFGGQTIVKNGGFFEAFLIGDAEMLAECIDGIG